MKCCTHDRLAALKAQVRARILVGLTRERSRGPVSGMTLRALRQASAMFRWVLDPLGSSWDAAR